MIVRNSSGFRAGLRLVVARNWLTVLVILAIEATALELHRLMPVLQTVAFSEAGVAVLAGAVGVFLSFRFNEAYGRWWEARTLWGGLVNASRTFARQSLTYLDGPDRSGLRDELVRGQIAFVNAMRATLRGEDAAAAAAPFLSDAALHELRDAKNWPTQIAVRQHRLVANALPDDAAGQLALSRFDHTLTELTALQGGTERIKNTAFPDHVTLTSRMLVWAVAVMVCLAFIDPIDVIYMLEFVAILIIVMAFKLVVVLGEELNDPFENRPNDTPMTSLCRVIEIDLLQMLGETDLPERIEPVDGILL